MSLYNRPIECRSFRNNIPQKTHSAKNHSAKKTFRNATIWQNNSAKNIRKLENRKQIIRQSNISQPRFGKKMFRNMPFGKVRFRKSNLEISHSENRVSANYIILVKLWYNFEYKIEEKYSCRTAHNILTNIRNQYRCNQ